MVVVPTKAKCGTYLRSNSCGILKWSLRMVLNIHLKVPLEQ